MQTAAVLFLHLLHGTNSAAKVGELSEFLLDGLQPLMPLAVNDMRLGFISALTPILLVEFMKLCDLGAEIPNLFAKDCEMIHSISIASRPIKCLSSC